MGPGDAVRADVSRQGPGLPLRRAAATGGDGGVLGRPNLHRPRDTHAGDPRFPFGWCASPEAPTPLSVPASNPRFATDPGVRRLRGRCPQLPDQLRTRLAWREATVRHKGVICRDSRLSCGPTRRLWPSCGSSLGDRSRHGRSAATADQLCGLGAVLYPEHLVGGAQVLLDGGLREEQPTGYLGVAQPFDH